MSQPFAKDVVMDGVRGSGENLFLGILTGCIAAILGAVLWMAITVATNMHLGLVAIGVGALVGITVRYFGNGTGMVFGILGAVLTLLGCLGGEVLTWVERSSSAQRDFISTLMSADLTQLLTTIFAQMDPISYLIYGIGIYEGYKLSIRK